MKVKVYRQECPITVPRKILNRQVYRQMWFLQVPVGCRLIMLVAGPAPPLGQIKQGLQDSKGLA